MPEIVRIYDGPEGKSVVEELSFADVQFPGIDFQPVTGLAFRTPRVNNKLDYHPGPRRQFLIILSGFMELGTGDRVVHRLGAGSVLLVDDLTGEGHTTEWKGEARFATIPLPEGWRIQGGRPAASRGSI